MFWQRIPHRDLVCNFWVDDSADGIGKGPRVEIEYWREFVSSAKVMYHNVRSAVGRECLHHLADCREMAEPETEWGLWLRYVSMVIRTGNGASSTYQSIESASMNVESDGKLYNGDGEKHEHCSPYVSRVQEMHELHHVGCVI